MNGGLTKDSSGYWTGYAPLAADGDRYAFWVEGSGSSGFKRDPCARELDRNSFPASFAILRADDAYPWHDQTYVTPDFSDMVIYQAHVGTYAITSPGVASTFLDVARKVPYLAALGVNMLQPLPIDEQESNPSMGYGGADIFSPDFPYVVGEPGPSPAYVPALNGLLQAKGAPPVAVADLVSGPNQLKALVDLCHLCWIGRRF